MEFTSLGSGFRRNSSNFSTSCSNLSPIMGFVKIGSSYDGIQSCSSTFCLNQSLVLFMKVSISLKSVSLNQGWTRVSLWICSWKYSMQSSAELSILGIACHNLYLFSAGFTISRIVSIFRLIRPTSAPLASSVQSQSSYSRANSPNLSLYSQVVEFMNTSSSIML